LPGRDQASACIYEGRTWTLPPPARHHHLLRAIRDDVAGEIDWGSVECGFLTTTGRYVDREEGARIALSSGQVEKLDAPPWLFSEDVW
jgi:hypothetical protein